MRRAGPAIPLVLAALIGCGKSGGQTTRDGGDAAADVTGTTDTSSESTPMDTAPPGDAPVDMAPTDAPPDSGPDAPPDMAPTDAPTDMAPTDVPADRADVPPTDAPRDNVAPMDATSADVRRDAGPPHGTLCGDGFVGTLRAVETDTAPRAVAAADFDRDGLPDIAVAASASSNTFKSLLTVARSLGAGAFAPPVEIPLAQLATAVVTADFNRDGAPDIAVASRGAAGVQVVLNRGDGTFGDPATYPTAAAPAALVAADLDGDGLLELVTASDGTRGIALVPGKADGTFGAKQDYLVGGNPSGVAVGDMNEDGIPDLVVSDSTLNASAIKTFIGTGGLRYAGATVATLTEGAIGLLVADLDEDRHLDVLAFASLGLRFMRGRGDGTYAQPVSVTTRTATGVTLVDLDGDGHLDLVTTSSTWFGSSGETVYVARGRGNGTFMPETSYPAGYLPVAAAAADFTGDGRVDLAVADMAGANVMLLAAIPGGFLAPPVFPLLQTQQPQRLAVVDLDRDGRPDVVTSTGAVLLANTMGGLAAPKAGSGSNRYAMAVTDWNGDGILDLLTEADTGGASVRIGAGDGTFAAAGSAIGTLPSVASVSAGDFDGDGKTDLALASFNSSDLMVAYGDGSGGVAQTITVDDSVAGTSGTVVADFDGDGAADLAIGANYRYTTIDSLRVIRGVARTPVPVPAIDLMMQPLMRFVGADVDGDGKRDLVVLSQATGVRTPARVAVFRGKGDATFEVGPWTLLPSRGGENSQVTAIPTDLAVADVDGDRAAELLILYSSRLEIWSLAAGTTLSRRAVYPYGGALLATGDVDRDGVADVVIGNQRGPGIIYLRSGCR